MSESTQKRLRTTKSCFHKTVKVKIQSNGHSHLKKTQSLKRYGIKPLNS